MSESQESFSIIVNQDEHKWPNEKIAYNDVVALYLQDGGAKSNEYLIKYSEGPKANPRGTLSPGGQVMVKNGMHFRVSGTGES
jgi:Multiubiquitin